MRLLLISDIHFESPNCLNRHSDPDWYYRNQLTNELTNRVADYGAFDAILLGGDTAYKGVSEEFTEALKWIDELIAVCGCTTSQVFVVPGNHDIDRARITGSRAVQNAQRAVLTAADHQRNREFRAQWASADSGRHLTETLTAYNEFAKIFDCQVYAPDRLFWQQELPLRDDVQLRIHGLTSALFCAAYWPQGKEEKPGELFLSSMQTVLPRDPDTVNLVLCHHPPDWFSDGDDVEDQVNARAAVQIFGHKHRRRHRAEDGFVRFSCPAVTPPKNELKWQPGYTVVELDVRGSDADRMLHVEAEVLVWQENPDCYVPVTMENGTTRLIRAIPLPARRVSKKSQPAPATSEEVYPSDSVPVEAAMGSPNVRNLIERFWKLPGSARREISLDLQLIQPTEVSLPEPERYGRALVRAAQDKKLSELEAAISAKEAMNG